MPFQEKPFVDFLGKLMEESKYLQNGLADVTPQEDRACKHIIDLLRPYSTEQGGPLIVKHITYVEGRGNLIVEYPGTNKDAGPMSFVGMHMDVVPANPDTWTFDPFTLTREGDQLRGRGTTDCLGHVALVALLMEELGRTKPQLERSVVAVFIANEENSRILGIGVDELVKRGELEFLKTGPIFWVDVADKKPCIGTGGVAAWTLKAYGKLFHSGMPQLSINPMELCMETLSIVQRRFYQDYPAHLQEAVYGFASSTSMKPTQFAFPGNSVNQIPAECSISGDIRVTPWYSVRDCMRSIEGYVKELNDDIESVPTRGPQSKYVLPAEGLRGRLEVTWGEGFTEGLSCDLSSVGYAAMHDAFASVLGKCETMAITGSLPCIKDLQDCGFDVQTLGFGLLSRYHANDEMAMLGDFEVGYKVLEGIIENMNSKGWAEKQKQGRGGGAEPAAAMPAAAAAAGGGAGVGGARKKAFGLPAGPGTPVFWGAKNCACPNGACQVPCPGAVALAPPPQAPTE